MLGLILRGIVGVKMWVVNNRPHPLFAYVDADADSKN
jgi:hypothetical protein